MGTSIASAWRRVVAWLFVEELHSVDAWHPFAAARDAATRDEASRHGTSEAWSNFDHLAVGPPPVL